MRRRKPTGRRRANPKKTTHQRRCPMFDKFGQIAEQLATNVSRRQFLGRFGRGALAVAAAVGALVALPAISRADKPTHSCALDSYWLCRGVPEGTYCGPGAVCKHAS